MTEQMPQQPEQSPEIEASPDQPTERPAEVQAEPVTPEPDTPEPDTSESDTSESTGAPTQQTAEEAPVEAEQAPAEKHAAAEGSVAEAATEGTAEEAFPAASVDESAAESAEVPVAEAPAEEAPSSEAPTDVSATAAEPTEKPTSEPAPEPTPADEQPTPEPAPADEQPTPEPAPAHEQPTPEPAPAHEQPTPERAPADAEPAKPATPGPGVPTPAMFAARKPAAPRPAPAAGVPGAPASPDSSAAVAEPLPPSESVKHGRVDEDGTVYVTLADGGERAVGSYPGASDEEALAYFARKYDELVAAADLLRARLASTDVSSHDARQSLNHLKEQIGEANVVGDLTALEATVSHLEGEISARARAEQEARSAAKAQAAVEREAIVAQAEKLAATDPARIQWKQSSARVRELLDEWKTHQRSGPRLDKDVESGLWQRFSAARSSFDKARKAWFAQMDEQHSEAKRLKERLVAEAEQLATSKDWGATAGAFKRLMQDWKRAGRASRSDDDALWQRFKTAQDTFFNAKDEVVAAEEAEFTENLKVKEALLAEAEALTIDEAHLDQAKSELRRIQDRWESAGKVPRADVRRVEGRLRAVEQQVRDLEDKKWNRTDPELAARAQSMVDQLERQVQGLQSDLEAARAAGDDRRASSLESEISTKQLWLDSARGGLSR